MSQYFSSIPRDFPHQRRGKQVPQEITGSVKRLDIQQNTQGDWNKLMQRTQDFQVVSDPNKQTEYRQRMIEDIKRGQKNIFPDSEGIQNDPVHYQRRVFPDQRANQNNTGGIINQLQREDVEQYVPQRQIQNTQQKQSHYDDYMNKYGKQGDEQKLLSQVEERNRGIGALQQRSQITNLPGSDYGRVERQPDRVPNPDLYKVRLQETTPEMYNNSNLTEYDFQKLQPHTTENLKHCQEEYDIIADKGLVKKFPEKKDNLYRTTYANEAVQPDSITGCRKKKAYNDPFHNHFQLG